MERFYNIAGIRIRVRGTAGEMYSEDGILELYRTEHGEWEHSFCFQKADEIVPVSGREVFTSEGLRMFYDGTAYTSYYGTVSESLDHAYLSIRRQGNESIVHVKTYRPQDVITPKTVLKAMEMEHQIAIHGGILFHSAFIRAGDGGILFTAPSETGKSTQAQLWCDLRGAELVNGDRSAVRVLPEGIFAWGVPFSGSSPVRKNQVLPLRAIVYLAQAPQTTISRLAGVKAFRRVWEGCSVHVWNRDEMERASQTVMEIVRRVPVYYLACTPDESAVIALEQELDKQVSL